jgi:hypothetical protein
LQREHVPPEAPDRLPADSPIGSASGPEATSPGPFCFLCHTEEISMTKTMSWGAAREGRPASATLLYLAAAVLRAGSEALAATATRLAAVRTRKAPGVVEFHPIYRDAGAPEGALYVDGHLVGVIEGVTRL